MKIEITWSDGKSEKWDFPYDRIEELRKTLRSEPWTDLRLSGENDFFNLAYARKIEILE